jgi:hypothetical protein
MCLPIILDMTTQLATPRPNHDRPPTPAASTPPVPHLPHRVGQLLLAYGDRAKGSRGELLAFPKAVGKHLRELLCAAGYVTSAPHLGIFASDAARHDLVVTARPSPQTRLH